jgi:hypothetical protein
MTLLSTGYRKLPFLLVLAPWLLVSCGVPKVCLQLHTEDARIRASILAAVDAYKPTARDRQRVELWPVERGSPGKNVPILHIGFRARSPTARTTDGLASLPGDFVEKRGFATGLALERWGRDGEGRWSAIPLFWDVWGVSMPSALRQSFGARDLDWTALDSLPKNAPRTALAGSAPAGRQALFAFLSARVGGAGDLLSLQAGEAGSSTPGLRSAFASFADADKDPRFLTDTLHFTEMDLANYRTDPQVKGVAFLESYREAYLAKTLSSRPFVPLPVLLQEGKYALVGTVLAAYMTGPFDRLGPAQDLIAYMISPEFQKRFSISVGLMPANFQAPVLESTNGAILLKTLQAEGLLGVNPDPRDEPQVKGLDSLLAAIRESPANWTSLVSRQK